MDDAPSDSSDPQFSHQILRTEYGDFQKSLESALSFPANLGPSLMVDKFELSAFESIPSVPHPIAEEVAAMSSIGILGATGTIGSVLARRLVRHGQHVVLIGRNEGKLRSLSQELGQPFVSVDLTGSQLLEEALQDAADAHGGFHGLVNCIGSILLKPAHSTTDDEFRQVVETNLFTAFTTIRVGAKLLRERGGTIILFASAAAEIGIQNHEAIAAAKAGVIGLARSAAATYAPNNIRVNVVSPGLVRTEMTRRIWENPASATASAQRHALGRLGEPEQVASLVSWLLDAENDWITGQVIGVDGGLGHVLPRR